jgi:hypothetical protein
LSVVVAAAAVVVGVALSVEAAAAVAVVAAPVLSATLWPSVLVSVDDTTMLAAEIGSLAPEEAPPPQAARVKAENTNGDNRTRRDFLDSITATRS